MASPNKTRVQVATDSQFTDIIVDEVGDYKTTLALASTELPVGSNLYIRGMHGHPDTGDSEWSTIHQFMVAAAHGNELYYTAGDYTFTVPAGVTEVCIAAVPGADYSAAGELLKTYIGRTTACTAGNNTVPVGISSITLSGNGANGTSTTRWKWYHTNSSLVSNWPTILNSPYPSSISAQDMGIPMTFTLYSATATEIKYKCGISEITYRKDTTANTTGASTTAVVNGTTYTFPGGVGGAASITNHTIEIDPATGATISANIAAGGSLSYSYSAYAINALSTLLGNNFSLSPVAKDIGTYVGGIAAWRNAIPVVPGDTIPVRVGSGGAVNIIWGTGRSFPDSEA